MSHRPKTEFRFGFKGPAGRERAEYQEATVDDILESLGRHSQLAEQLGPHEELEPDVETEESEKYFTPDRPTALRATVHGSIGRYGFGLMLVGGFMILVIYSVLRAVMSASSTPTTAVGAFLTLILNDPLKLGLMGILFLVPVVMAKKRRNRISRLTWL